MQERKTTIQTTEQLQLTDDQVQEIKFILDNFFNFSLSGYVDYLNDAFYHYMEFEEHAQPNELINLFLKHKHMVQTLINLKEWHDSVKENEIVLN